MPYLPRQLAILLFFGASLSSLQAAPGTSVPWTTYEAEAMTNSAAAILSAAV